MTRTFEILPAARSWPPEAEHIAQALAADARRPPVQAAVSLLLQLGPSFWARPDLTKFYNPTQAGMFVDWDLLEIALDDYQVPASHGEHAVVALAASLAGEAEVDLEWALGHLTPELVDAFVDAARHAAAQSTEDET